MVRISKWIAAAMIFAAPALASDRFEKTLSASVDYRGGRVTIEHRFGSITVRTGSEDQVKARATIRTSDAELGKAFRFAASNSSNGVVIRTIVPSMHSHGEDLSWSADLEVTVPDRAPLDVRNQFGSIDVSGMDAPLEIINRQGSVEARNIRGGRITNSFGSIRVEQSEGDTTLQNTNGSIAAANVSGTLAITNRFASVMVEHVGKGASISNTNGAVSAVDVKGPTSISNGFASVEARNIGGPLSIANQNGNVTAIDINGDLSVDTRYGLVKAEKIRGNLSVDDAFGGVSANDINGDAHVHTSFASVFLKGIDGGVEVDNQNGSIAVSGLRGGCNNVSLRTSFSAIKIALPSNASYAVTARTSFGSISTEVPFTVTSKSSTDQSSSFSGTIGGGQCRMELVTSNGGITITRE